MQLRQDMRLELYACKGDLALISDDTAACRKHRSPSLKALRSPAPHALASQHTLTGPQRLTACRKHLPSTSHADTLSSAVHTASKLSLLQALVVIVVVCCLIAFLSAQPAHAPARGCPPAWRIAAAGI